MLLFTEISLQAEKYLDKQIENAVNGVKEMKNVMQKSSEDHKKFLDALEKTKEQKEVPDNTSYTVRHNNTYCLLIISHSPAQRLQHGGRQHEVVVEKMDPAKIKACLLKSLRLCDYRKRYAQLRRWRPS